MFAVTDIPQEVWFNHIFPLLTIDDLVFVRRTCKDCAADTSLVYAIELRIKEVFHGYGPERWNRMAPIEGAHKITVQTNETLYIGPLLCLRCDYSSATQKTECTLGIYSCQERLRHAYEEWLAELMATGRKYRVTDKHPFYCYIQVKWARDGGGLSPWDQVYFCGINVKVPAYVKISKL